MKLGIVFLVVTLSLIFIMLRRHGSGEPGDNPGLTGGIYSIPREDGSFRIAKVLVVEDQIIHLRIYANSFSERPSQIDPAALSLGKVTDGKGNFGIGHIPLTIESFRHMSPVYLQTTDVTEDELDGYHIWKESRGGTFGG